MPERFSKWTSASAFFSAFLAASPVYAGGAPQVLCAGGAFLRDGSALAFAGMLEQKLPGTAVSVRLFMESAFEPDAVQFSGFLMQPVPAAALVVLDRERPAACALGPAAATQYPLPEDYVAVLSSVSVCYGRPAAAPEPAESCSCKQEPLSRASAESEAGRHDQAVAILESALPGCSCGTELLSLLMREKIMGRDFYGALRLMQTSVSRSPRHAEDFYRSFFYSVNAMGGTKKTRQYAPEELRKSASSTALHNALALAWLPPWRGDRFNGDPLRDGRMALYYALKGLAANPCSAELALSAAEAYASLGEAARAEAFARRALASEPRLEAAYELLARLQCGTGSYEEAYATAEVLKRLNPAAGLSAAAQTAAFQARFDESVAFSTGAFALAPTPVYAKLAARAWRLAGDQQQAQDWYVKAARLNPDDVEVSFELGRVLLALDRKKEALVWFRKAAEAVPVSKEAYLDMARILSWLEPELAVEVGSSIPGFRSSANFQAMKDCLSTESANKGRSALAAALSEMAGQAQAKRVKLAFLAVYGGDWRELRDGLAAKGVGITELPIENVCGADYGSRECFFARQKVVSEAAGILSGLLRGGKGGP